MLNRIIEWIKPVYVWFFARLNRHRQIFLLGDGRSGTTWVAQAINFDRSFLDFFEPFHGRDALHLPDSRMYPTGEDLDRLGLRSPRIDDPATRKKVCHRVRVSKKFLHSGILVKDVAAHLIAGRVQASGQKVVYILRNPVSIALSKEAFGVWHSEADIRLLADLSTDLTGVDGYNPLHQSQPSKFLEYIFVWCVLTRQALAQLSRGEVVVVFYEKLRDDPESGFGVLFSQLGMTETFDRHREQVLAAVAQRSRTTVQSNTLGENLSDDNPWRKPKPAEEVEATYRMLKQFGLYGIYEGALAPKMSAGEVLALARSWPSPAAEQ